MNYPYPCVSAFIQNGEGKVLLTLRSPKVWEPNQWCLPGGHLDGGETWEIAVRKEVNEETGLIALETQLIGIYSDPMENTIDAGGTPRHFLCACFKILRYEGTLKANEEVTQMGWFSAESLPTPMLKSEPRKIRDAIRDLPKVAVY